MEQVGTLGAMWRHPVKSMLGERIDASAVSERGLAGDRAYALRDVETGKVVSAKRPRYWGGMLGLRARFQGEPGVQIPLPPVVITTGQGVEISSEDPQADRLLSDALGRKVSLISSIDDIAMLEEVWIEEKNADPYGPVVGSEGDDRLIEIPASIGAPPGTLFDYSALHLVTTSTLAALANAYPEGTFDPRRFRPNFVIEVPDAGFVENDWIGRTLHIGDSVTAEVLVPTPRCVMTTLPQGDDLPKDRGILRAAASANAQDFGPFTGQPCVGVYAEVTAGGEVRAGDAVHLE